MVFMTQTEIAWAVFVGFVLGVLVGTVAFWVGYKFGCRSALEFYRQSQRKKAN